MIIEQKREPLPQRLEVRYLLEEDCGPRIRELLKENDIPRTPLHYARGTKFGKNGFEGLQLKNSRIAEWLKKALKESHQDAINYETSSLKELQDRLAQVEKRLDRLYDDKLDEKITKAFYDQKFRQYNQEKADIVATIEKHTKAKNNHFDLGINLYELSQMAKEIYLKAKECHLLEEQRRLISLVFTNMTLNEGILAYEYAPAFKLIYNAVAETNSSKVANLAKNGAKIFEPVKLPDNSAQKWSLQPSRPTWLDK